jgi:hypothetical protein
MPDTEVDPPFPAYVGTAPFVFVSYSHKDAPIVFPELKALHELGYRLWFDEGIDPGNEWPVEIARALKRSAMFIVFISPNAVTSHNVNNEIQLALSIKKPFVAIHLCQTELPDGLDLSIGARQAILRYRMSEHNYRRKMGTALPPALQEVPAIAELQTPRVTEARSQTGPQAPVRTNGPGFQWHYIHPEHQNRLIARITSNKGPKFSWWQSARKASLLVGLSLYSSGHSFGDTATEDAQSILESGAVSSVFYRGGKMCLSVNLDALAITSQDSLLAALLRALQPARKQQANAALTLLKKIFLLNIQPARDELEREFKNCELDNCLQAAILSRFYADSKAARSRLKDNSRNLVDAAKTLFALFGDANASYATLKLAEADIRYSWQRVSIAGAWKAIFDDEGYARGALEQAQTGAERSSNWCDVAEGWSGLIGKVDAARHCLGQAEAVAEDANDWSSIADKWKVIFDDAGAARRCLRQAEANAKESMDWTYLARGWMNILNDADAARHCLKQAEAIAKDSLDWTVAARCRKDLFNDAEEASRLLKKAESVAQDSLYWTFAASGWKDVFNDDEATRRCLKQAETVAGGSRDWKHTADAWKACFNDTETAQRCLRQAEAVAKTASDWKYAADGWKACFNDTETAHRCLKQAEAAAKTASDWNDAATGYKNILSDENGTRRCLKQAEAAASRSFDYYLFAAQGWKDLLNDAEGARRCLKRAEEVARNPHDWGWAATGWREIVNDLEAAQRCEAKAKAAKK